MRISMKQMLLATSLLAPAVAHAEEVTLTIESWRQDDLQVWQEKIIPAFEAGHPGIKLVFAPTQATEYNAALNAKLDAGAAGDIISCRPFDASLALFEKKQLADLTDLPGIENFPPVAKVAWTTDDGSRTFCVPMAAVMHGFIYNKDVFEQLGLSVPVTRVEFFAVLEKIKADGNYIPLAMGTKDLWEAATVAYQNIGPNYWKGEEGRQGLIEGKAKLTDPGWVAPLQELEKWRPYLGDGFEAQTYSDSQNLFTLGRAAIYPAGSWEIALFNAQAQFNMGAFPPPVEKAGDTGYISDQPDLGVGMNANTAQPAAARKFLSWVASKEFAEVQVNALPGFFSLINTPVDASDPIAQEFLSWRKDRQSTLRSTYQILSRGTPNLESETWLATANVINGIQTPQEASDRLQAGLESWYKPATAK
jgi:raffinose/stachyose/melibiose transport system substrate-binding protein